MTIWNLASREQMSTVKAYDQALSSLAFSSDGKTLTTTCYSVREVKLWDVANLELKDAMPCDFPVMSSAYSPDGRLLALGLDDLHGTIELRDVVHHAEILSIRAAGIVPYALVFSPNGRRLISAGEMNVEFWDTASGDLRFKLAAHRDGIFCVAISPDGKTLATGSADDTVKLWRAATDDEVHQMRQRWQDITRAQEMAQSGE